MIQNSTYDFLKEQCINEKCASLAKLAFLNYKRDPISLKWVEKNLPEFRLDFNITNEPLQPTPNVEDIQDEGNDKEPPRDYRIKRLYVNNYRKFPPRSTPVGINMVNEEIRSLFLVGRNGIGKSSLYVALEAICRGNISEAKLRNLNQVTYEVHNDIASNSSNDRLRIIETNTGEFKTYEDFFCSCGVDISACFCSENDIYEVGKTDFSNSNSLKDFFISCLGFNYLLNLRKGLERIKSKLEQEYQEASVPDDPTNNLENIDKEIDLLINQLTSINVENAGEQENIKQHLNQCQHYDLKMTKDASSIRTNINEIIHLLQYIKIQSLEDPIKKLVNLLFLLQDLEVVNPEESNAEKLESIYKDAKNTINHVTNILSEAIEKKQRAVSININEIKEKLGDLFIEKQKYNEIQNKLNRIEHTIITQNNILTEEIKEFLQQINSFFEKEIASFMDPTQDERKLIDTILTHFSQEDRQERENERINIDYKEDKTLSISISYYENGELKQGISPSRYYNTFRYKLFCMMLRIAIAFTIMKREKIFFPLIWDDIFYSSDYRNKAQVLFFMQKIVSAFECIFPNQKDMLQIICFTHDELIMKAFIEAAKTHGRDDATENEQTNTSLENAIFGRLFSYVEITREDEKETENKKKYDNLYTIIPITIHK